MEQQYWLRAFIGSSKDLGKHTERQYPNPRRGLHLMREWYEGRGVQLFLFLPFVCLKFPYGCANSCTLLRGRQNQQTTREKGDLERESIYKPWPRIWWRRMSGHKAFRTMDRWLEVIQYLCSNRVPVPTDSFYTCKHWLPHWDPMLLFEPLHKVALKSSLEPRVKLALTWCTPCTNEQPLGTSWGLACWSSFCWGVGSEGAASRSLFLGVVAH